MMTNGLKTTIDTTLVTLVLTDKLPPSGARRPTSSRPDTDTDTTVLPLSPRRVPSTTLPLNLASLATGASPDPTGMLMVVTKISPSRNLMTAPGPSPTMPSPMTNGTTRTTISMALRLGARTAMSTVPPQLARLPPPETTTPTAAVATARDTARALATASNPLLRPPLAREATAPTRTLRLPATTPLPVPATITTSGPSRPMAATSTADGASLTTPSPPNPTTTSNTPARFRLMTTSGPRTTTATTAAMPTDTAGPPPPPSVSPARSSTASATPSLSPATTHGEC